METKSEINIQKIVVLGPESTGKSTLCTQLAAHYNTCWVPEHARAYLLQHGTNYTYDDLLQIAQGQVKDEEEALQVLRKELSEKNQSPGRIIIDTDMYVMKVWCEFVFGQCHDFIKEQLLTRHYDLYLLCAPDLPWLKDELREYPDLQTREELYKIYRTLMKQQAVPYVIIEGGYEERLQKAIRAIDELT